jgi:hypothetical protein
MWGRHSAVGEETMVAMTLTKEMIESGGVLVRKLDEQGLQPDAAFWLYDPDLQKWKLIIVEVKLGVEGPKKIYKKIQDVISVSKEDMPDISLESVTLAKPDAPIVNLLKKAMRTGDGISGIRFTNNVINGTVIEDAYIYRMN